MEMKGVWALAARLMASREAEMKRRFIGLGLVDNFKEDTAQSRTLL